MKMSATHSAGASEMGRFSLSHPIDSKLPGVFSHGDVRDGFYVSRDNAPGFCFREKVVTLVEEKVLKKLGREAADILGLERSASGTYNGEAFCQAIENMTDLEIVRFIEELAARGCSPAIEHLKYREATFNKILKEMKTGTLH